MKKGFTLIELLAVIVILAIIALIATPAVLNTIEDSKKAAAEASARNIVGASKTYYMQNIMENKTNSSIDLSTDTLKYDGDKAEKGTLNYDKNGNVYGKMYISGYCIEITSDGNITSNKSTSDECDTHSSQTTTFANGEVVYYNPETNKKCDSSEANANTSLNSGCMKWYAFLDDGSDTINLLLSHNTTASSAWSESSGQAPTIANSKLASDVSSWNSEVKSTTRLVKAQEIANITGNSSWHSEGNAFYFHTNSSTIYTGSKSTNKYAWLFDNTMGCLEFGCNEEKDNVSGYWTDTVYPGYSGNSWFVGNSGEMNIQLSDEGYYGIRPVITINRNVIK